MSEKKIQIIPRIHGKRTRDGKVSEPDKRPIPTQCFKPFPEQYLRISPVL
jgi:hypothetical protein